MYRNAERGKEFELLNSPYTKADGTPFSMFETANQTDSYEEFLKTTREAMERAGASVMLEYTTSEQGQRELRKIYMSANRFDRDIKVLSEEGVNADFQQSVLKCMNREGFANQNAQTAIEQLKAAAETSKLTVQQAGAWNDILERMGKRTNSKRHTYSFKYDI